VDESLKYFLGDRLDDLQAAGSGEAVIQQGVLQTEIQQVFPCSFQFRTNIGSRIIHDADLPAWVTHTLSPIPIFGVDRYPL
jgi:hypothetical protein